MSEQHSCADSLTGEKRRVPEVSTVLCTCSVYVTTASTAVKSSLDVTGCVEYTQVLACLQTESNF